MTLLKSTPFAIALLATGFSGAAAAALDTGMIPAPHIATPKGDITAAVVLISDAAGWGAAEDKASSDLVAKGAVVIGIDFPAYIKSLATDTGDCVYTIADIEALTQQVERNLGVETYRKPIIAGVGEGGALALAMAAQTPPATVEATLAIDPLAGIPALPRVLCTPASKQTKGERVLYGLTPGPLPDPVTVLFTSKADADGRAHVQSLAGDWPDITFTESADDAHAALGESLAAMIAAAPSDDGTLGLPLTVLDAKPVYDTMAVILSGDGGWRDIDAQVGDEFQKNGIPVVGLDSLRYFWSKKTPEQVEQDLSRIIAHYRSVFGVKKVLLAGYSFGADVLPDAYVRLPQAQKDSVALVALLAMSGEADYEISVMSIMGSSASTGGVPNMEAVAKIDPKRLTCVYGSEEEDDPCPTLAATGVETVRIKGGHHFDEDYPALAQKLISSLKDRLSK